MIKLLYNVICIFLSVHFCTAQHVDVVREPLGKVKDSRLNELSGLERSVKHPQCFWTHNDSGDSARFFLIDTLANLKATYRLEGINAIDIEDIAIYTHNGKTYLVLADIGDNLGRRKNVQLYIFEEPDVEEGRIDHIISREQIRILTLTYPDKARDAEAIFVDPLDLTCYLIAKRDFHVGVYPIDIVNAKTETSLVLKKAFELPITFVTAASISTDGQYILVKNLTDIFFWKREEGSSIQNAVAKQPIRLCYTPEPQGEAICFDHKNSLFYTISERPLGLDAYLYRYTFNLSN